MYIYHFQTPNCSNMRQFSVRHSSLGMYETPAAFSAQGYPFYRPYSVSQNSKRARRHILRSDIGVRRVLEDLDALMPYVRMAEKYVYLNCHYICLNNQSIWLLPTLLGKAYEASVHHTNQCISIFWVVASPKKYGDSCLTFMVSKSFI